jgi:hypothetical protein
MRWVLIAAIWGTAGFVALLFAAGTAYGPILLVVDQTRAEGIHLGDVVCVAVCSTWAFFTSRSAYRKYAPSKYASSAE